MDYVKFLLRLFIQVEFNFLICHRFLLYSYGILSLFSDYDSVKFSGSMRSILFVYVVLTDLHYVFDVIRVVSWYEIYFCWKRFESNRELKFNTFVHSMILLIANCPIKIIMLNYFSRLFDR